MIRIIIALARRRSRTPDAALHIPDNWWADHRDALVRQDTDDRERDGQR